MKSVRTYNWHCDGSNSRINIHFEDGTQFSRTVSCADAMRLCKEGKSVIPVLMEKYRLPDLKPVYVERFASPNEEKYYTLLGEKKATGNPLSADDEEFIWKYEHGFVED